MCVDLETRVIRWPILTLHFKCIEIGKRVSWIKPQDGNNVSQIAKLEVSDPKMYNEVEHDFETEFIQLTSD